LKKSTGFRATAAALLLLGLAAATAAGTYAARSNDDDSKHEKRVAMRDDCDPTDPGWAPTGGCARKRGNVGFAEFNAALNSPLSTAVVGHQAWRNDPSYLVIKEGTNVRVKNAGGRNHTFTEVKAFGGGLIPPLSTGLTLAPECPLSIGILPGESAKLTNLAVGDHLFQCCFHPWMRAAIKVKAKTQNDDDGDDHHSHH
jgi:plastocyanin